MPDEPVNRMEVCWRFICAGRWRHIPPEALATQPVTWLLMLQYCENNKSGSMWSIIRADPDPHPLQYLKERRSFVCWSWPYVPTKQQFPVCWQMFYSAAAAWPWRARYTTTGAKLPPSRCSLCHRQTAEMGVFPSRRISRQYTISRDDDPSDELAAKETELVFTGILRRLLPLPMAYNTVPLDNAKCNYQISATVSLFWLKTSAARSIHLRWNLWWWRNGK